MSGPRRVLIRGGILVTPSLVLPGGAVLVEDSRIAAVFPDERETRTWVEARPGAVEILDARGDYVLPGFLDLHCHGGGGFDFMDGDPESVVGTARSHLEHGTTSILPTTLASSRPALDACLSAFRRAKGEPGCPDFLGLHLEGPYFSQAQRGAQDPAHIRDPDPAEYLSILDSSDDIARWTLAPELPGALDMAAELVRRGILPSIGHSDATLEETFRAFDAGFTLVTHLYSAMSTVKRVGGYRVPGVLEAAWLLDGLYVELIADGRHLPPSLLRLARKIKGPDRCCLVTYAMRAAGLPDGTYPLGAKDGGQSAVVREGVAWIPDGTAFAGSVATAERLFATAVRDAGFPLAEAASMWTLAPARAIGAEGRKGSLAPGKDADIVTLSPEFETRLVLSRGRTARPAYGAAVG
ncbi:MAG: N-acetylglucosamine-6-phosphate deacetylase [Treponema sp.]|nr:N-acetylglucosamine-6-phosphate deacetylase [Treponema sp.]